MFGKLLIERVLAEKPWLRAWLKKMVVAVSTLAPGGSYNAGENPLVCQNRILLKSC
jgi:hypothetical protein